MSTTHPCIFCEIIQGASPASVVYQDSTCTAFLDIHPINAGHTLVVPNKHVERFFDLAGDEAEHLFGIAHRIYKAIKASPAKSEGANIFLSDGAVAGQEVMHSHLHIVPRFQGDGHRVGFSSTTNTSESTREILNAFAQDIRSNLAFERALPISCLDSVLLFVSDVEKSKAWYTQVLGVSPHLEIENFAEFRIGGNALGLHPVDEKSPLSTGGQVAYWSVDDFQQAKDHFVANGGKVYRGPLEIEDGRTICQILDPFGNTIGLIGK